MELHAAEKPFNDDKRLVRRFLDGPVNVEKLQRLSEALGQLVFRGVVGRFISVTQVGDAASVQLSFDADKSWGWIDFHSLLRVDGVWKITNKTATHSSR